MKICYAALRIDDGQYFCENMGVLPNGSFVEIGTINFYKDPEHFIKCYQTPFEAFKLNANSDYENIFKIEICEDSVFITNENSFYVSKFKLAEKPVNDELLNIGLKNKGINNTGNSNIGYCNSGNDNTGNDNTGNDNTGNGNSGNNNIGNFNTEGRNKGNRNTGFGNSGVSNSGNNNIGNGNTGNDNFGWCNSGGRNKGNRNTGFGNKCDHSSGFFNTNSSKVSLFNGAVYMDYLDVVKHPAYQAMISAPFILIGDTRDYDEWYTAWKKWWGELTDENKKTFLTFPGFDAEIFKEITGIDVDLKE